MKNDNTYYFKFRQLLLKHLYHNHWEIQLIKVFKKSILLLLQNIGGFSMLNIVKIFYSVR